MVRKNINIEDIETEVIEINKNETNKNKKVVIRKVIDIEVKTKITIYKYYPDKKGKYNIKKEHNTPIQYGSNIKAMAVDMMVSTNNSVYENERKLLSRFEDKKELKEILYFIEDFKIPSTNNQIETDLRPIKIKQKIGKFRSKNCNVFSCKIKKL